MNKQKLSIIAAFALLGSILLFFTIKRNKKQATINTLPKEPITNVQKLQTAKAVVSLASALIQLKQQLEK